MSKVRTSELLHPGDAAPAVLVLDHGDVAAGLSVKERVDVFLRRGEAAAGSEAGGGGGGWRSVLRARAGARRVSARAGAAGERGASLRNPPRAAAPDSCGDGAAPVDASRLLLLVALHGAEDGLAQVHEVVQVAARVLRVRVPVDDLGTHGDARLRARPRHGGPLAGGVVAVVGLGRGARALVARIDGVGTRVADRVFVRFGGAETRPRDAGAAARRSPRALLGVVVGLARVLDAADGVQQRVVGATPTASESAAVVLRPALQKAHVVLGAADADVELDGRRGSHSQVKGAAADHATLARRLLTRSPALLLLASASIARHRRLAQILKRRVHLPYLTREVVALDGQLRLQTRQSCDTRGSGLRTSRHCRRIAFLPLSPNNKILFVTSFYKRFSLYSTLHCNYSTLKLFFLLSRV